MLKIVPYWLVNFLIWTGLLHWISSVFRLATTSHSELISHLTQSKDLQALSAYLFYGAGHTQRHIATQIRRYILFMVLFHLLLLKASLLKTPAFSLMPSSFTTTSVVHTIHVGAQVNLPFTSSQSFSKQVVQS